MNKIGVVFFVFALLILIISFVGLASADLDDTSDLLDDKVESLEDTVDAVENIDETIETKWDYLGKEWKNILLKNKVVSVIDSFFQKISFVFEIFFNKPYSLSLSLLFIIILWAYFFLKIREILGDFLGLSLNISSLISLFTTMAFIYSRVIENIVKFFGWLVFTQEASWARTLVFLAIVFIMFMIYKFTSFLGDAIQARKEELEKEGEKRNRGILRNFANAIVKSWYKN